jgi:hypothetical protein
MIARPSFPDAACLESDLDFFDNSQANRWALKRVCATCLIRTECLEMAVQAEQGEWRTHRYGIFGGTTPTERWRMEQRSNQNVAS